MKTIRFKAENFDLLLQGPAVKSTTIRAGDKTKRFKVGERIAIARCIAEIALLENAEREGE